MDRLEIMLVKQDITLDSTGVHFLGGKITFPRDTKVSFLRATRLSPSHPVKLAAVTSVSPQSSPAEPSVMNVDDFPPPPSTAELNAVQMDGFLPPPPRAVETNGVRVYDFTPPPPAVRVETNVVRMDDFTPQYV